MEERGRESRVVALVGLWEANRSMSTPVTRGTMIDKVQQVLAAKKLKGLGTALRELRDGYLGSLLGRSYDS
jgi:hypothetical protein